MDANSEVIVVGSGPAGAMAAWALRGLGVRLLDFGNTSAGLPKLQENLYSLRRKTDLTPHLIGPNFEALRYLRRDTPVSLKLRAPALEFVIRNWEELAPLTSSTFRPVISLAKGGFANAWGAGVYRFGEDDLRGYPIGLADLSTHYDAVAQHIGISGSRDDLWEEFGEEPSLDPPLRLSRNCGQLLASYNSRRSAWMQRGVRFGRPRLAVITQPRRGREPYAYRCLEFVQTGDPAMYNPAMTIDELSRAGAIQYEPGWLVEKFRESETGVEVIARDSQNTRVVFRSRTLILAAGALNSARIVLASFADFTTRLPLLDNPMTVLAMFHPRSFGTTLQQDDPALAQLNVVLAAEQFGTKYQASLYGCNGAPMSDFVGTLPLPMDVSRRLLRYLLPALSLAIVFHPAEPSARQSLRLREDGALDASYEWHPDNRLAGRLSTVFRGLGTWTAAGMAKHRNPGEGIHYAGTLPMAASPGPYQLDTAGRLQGTRNVYVCDGACLPRLPAKNHTYTVMANAHRIATSIARRVAR
ncbi:MAG: GMC family oxidoreductase [Bryobacterales bacterium]|nr:GMC family oxidoreductase [Bryobacterales bacterium]